MISAYSIGLTTLEIICYVTSIVILFRTYGKTRYLAHLIQGISFCFLQVNSLLRFTTSFFNEEIILYETAGGIQLGLVGILWSLMNIFLIIGIYLLFFSFFYIKIGSFHPLLNLISIIMGAIIFAFSYPTFTELVFDTATGSWTANYNILVMLLIIPLFVVFIAFIIWPLAVKIRVSSYQEQKMQITLQVIGLGTILLWSLLAAFTSFNEILALVRPFLLPVGWIVWSLTLLMDPFNIMVSNAKVSQIYIATEDGLPFYFNDLEGTQNISSTLAATIISGVKTALEELVRSEDKISVLNYEKQVLGIVSVENLRAYVFGERFDKILETVLRFLLQSIYNNPKVAFQLSQQVIALDEESSLEIQQMVDEALKSVLIL